MARVVSTEIHAFQNGSVLPIDFLPGIYPHGLLLQAKPPDGPQPPPPPPPRTPHFGEKKCFCFFYYQVLVDGRKANYYFVVSSGKYCGKPTSPALCREHCLVIREKILKRLQDARDRGSEFWVADGFVVDKMNTLGSGATQETGALPTALSWGIEGEDGALIGEEAYPGAKCV